MAEDPRVGQILDDRYKVIEPLASGGIGAVYRGERIKLGREVAIKFLHAWAAAVQMPFETALAIFSGRVDRQASSNTASAQHHSRSKYATPDSRSWLVASLFCHKVLG